MALLEKNEKAKLEADGKKEESKIEAPKEAKDTPTPTPGKDLAKE